jgi:hypothetical protein
VIVDPPAARLARLARAAGLPGAAAGSGGQPGADGAAPVEIRREPGLNWAWPEPFAARHAVARGPQRVRLRAIFRQTGPDSYDVVLVELRFQISDLERWAQRDADGRGVDRLAAELSAVLQNVIQQARREARQALVQDNPSLANDQLQLAARADQLVEARLEELVRAFVGAASGTDATREAGVQIAREYASGLARGVPGAVAGAAPDE